MGDIGAIAPRVIEPAIVLLAVFLLFAWVSPGDAAALPSCADGPRTNKALDAVEGTDCVDVIVVRAEDVDTVKAGAGDDIIFVNGEVTEIFGGEGDDHLYGELPSARQLDQVVKADGDAEPAYPVYRTEQSPVDKERSGAAASEVKYGGDGNQTWFGGSGEDWFYGQRGNDTFYGGGGHDLLYGGPGDDFLHGQDGWDILGGGFGTDYLDGGNDNDMARGDATTDTIVDSGASGTDTLSFATATAPGFTGGSPMTGFPAEGGERGVFVRLDAVPCSGEGGYEACNGEAATGGGYDQINSWQFENVIGSPFADVIVGNASANRIDGGGGADVIYGSEGADVLVGGADGDYLDGGGGTDTAYGLGGTNNCSGEVEIKNECAGSAAEVNTRNTNAISVGFEQTSIDPTARSVQLYMVGSNLHDSVRALEWWDTVSQKMYISFELQPDSTASFDTSAGAQTPGCIYWSTVVHCGLPAMADSVVLAGMAANDTITIHESGIDELTSPVVLGGSGDDIVWGDFTTEDVLVDGDGNDWMYGASWDDVLLNNAGTDFIQGGLGNDLIVSTDVCSGDYLNGSQEGVVDGAQNSASWAKLSGSGVVASIDSNIAGNSGSGGIKCTSGSPSTIAAFADLEGSEQNDILIGSNAPNGILGRNGDDWMTGLGGNDFLYGLNTTTGAADGTDAMNGDSGTNHCFLGGPDSAANCVLH
ncbi:MAG TPA: calcium-binding protein [Solirubrobacterales bacterium]